MNAARPKVLEIARASADELLSAVLARAALRHALDTYVDPIERERLRKEFETIVVRAVDAELEFLAAGGQP